MADYEEAVRELEATMLAEMRLLREYVVWRLEAGLLPTRAEGRRLARWRRQAKRWGSLLPCCYDEGAS